MSAAKAEAVPLTLIRYETGGRSFDIETSVPDEPRDIVGQTLEFLKAKLARR